MKGKIFVNRVLLLQNTSNPYIVSLIAGRGLPLRKNARPDFRRGDREIGWGYARSAALLDRAAKSSLVDVEVEPRGYAQSLLSAPLATTALAAARSEMLRCHLLRERVRKASDAERADQVDQAGSDTEAPRP